VLEAIENGKEAANVAAVGAVVGAVAYHQIGGAGLALGRRSLSRRFGCIYGCWVQFWD
jgi:hypothetical protein